MSVLLQIWALSTVVILAGCLLRLRPVTVAILMPPVAGLFLFVRVLV